MASEYPMMLYRKGTELWQHGADYIIIESEAEMVNAFADGWQEGLDFPEEPELLVAIELELNPLDHDANGEPGGSVAPEPTDGLAALRAEYKALTGKNVFPGWGVEEITKRMDAFKAAQDGAEGEGA